METALNTIFKVKKRRHFFFSIIVSLVVVTLIIALVTTSFAAASVIPLLKTLGQDMSGIRFGKITKFLLQFVLPFVLVLFSIMLLYVLVPKTRVALSSALRGAFFAAVMLELAKARFYLVRDRRCPFRKDLWPAYRLCHVPALDVLFFRHLFNRRRNSA